MAKDLMIAEVDMTFAICTRNRVEYLRGCVGALRESCAQLKCTWEILVVDNASTDRTADWLRSLPPEHGVRFFVEPRPGVANARNAAIRQCRGEILAFLDDDILPPECYAVALWRDFRAKSCDVMGGAILPRWEARRPRWLTEDLHTVLGLLTSQQTVEDGLPRVFTGNAAFLRKRLLDFGPEPFDPRLGRVGKSLLGNEESFLITQLWQQGATIAFSQDAAVLHRVPADRLTLRHFIRYKYCAGVSGAREAYIQSGRLQLPRWVWGDLFRRLAGMGLCLVPGLRQRGLHNLLGFAHRLGRIVEYRRLRRSMPKTKAATGESCK